MRTFPQPAEAVVLDAVENVSSLWASLGVFFQGSLIEVMVVVLALCIYLVYVGTAKPKAPKIPINGNHRQTSSRGNGKGFTSVGNKAIGSCCKTDVSQQVQKLVVNLMQKSQKTNPAALLEKYEQIMQACGGNLRSHLADDQNASSMYLALVGCAAALPSTAPGPSRPCPGCTDGFSNMQRWISSLLADMQVCSFHRGVDFYAFIIKQLVHDQHFHEGLWVYDVMTKDGVEPNSALLISLLNTSILASESNRAFFFFEELCKVSPPSVRTVMTLLRLHTASKDWQGAVRVLDRMDSLGTSPDNLVLNNVLGL